MRQIKNPTLLVVKNIPAKFHPGKFETMQPDGSTFLQK